LHPPPTPTTNRRVPTCTLHPRYQLVSECLHTPAFTSKRWAGTFMQTMTHATPVTKTSCQLLCRLLHPSHFSFDDVRCLNDVLRSNLCPPCIWAVRRVVPSSRLVQLIQLMPSYLPICLPLFGQPAHRMGPSTHPSPKFLSL
jgi:hypothetical protein